MAHHYHDMYSDTPSDNMYLAAHLLKRLIGKNTSDKHLYNVLYLLQALHRGSKGLFRYRYALGPYFPEISIALKYKNKEINPEDYELNEALSKNISKLLLLLEETRPKSTEFQEWADRVAFLCYIQNHTHGKNKGNEKFIRNAVRECGRKDVSRRFKSIDAAIKHIERGI